MNNYIDISKQQRVVFVDNIKYEDAKALSKRYPFAMFVTEAKDNVYHTIWRNGYCYSYISEVDTTPITIDTYSISLNITPGVNGGKLSLNVGNAISNFELIKYKSDNGSITTYSSGLDIKNSGELFFKIYGINNTELNEYNRDGINLLEFRIYKNSDPNHDIKNDYISGLQSIKDTTWTGIKYIFNIEQEYINNDLKLEVSYRRLGETIIKTYPLILRKTIESELIWIGTGNPYDIPYNMTEDTFEISNNQIEANIDTIGWHYLNDLKNQYINIQPIIYDYYHDHPLNVGRNIYVIIPESKALRVKLIEDEQTYYVIDEGDSTYTYSIIRRCTINNKPYKVLKLNNPEIIEFINIIQ